MGCEVLTSPDDLSEAASTHVQCQQSRMLLGKNMTASLRSAATMDQLQRNINATSDWTMDT